MGVIIEALIDWQLLHMDGTLEEARMFLTTYLASNKD